MRRWIAGACLAASLAWGIPAGAQGETDFRALFPSIVRVVGLSADGVVGLGSGVVVGGTDTGSYVVTNYHVISGATAAGIRIVAPNPKEGGPPIIISAARYVSGDSGTDIAVLYVANFKAPPVPLAPATARENLPVRAIGYPGTDFQQWRQPNTTPTISDGIVSTTATAPWRPGLPAVGQVQHTADLNEGMSGGPLLDVCGRVLAINTAFNMAANGANLALSTADVTPYLQRLNITYTATTEACDPAAAAARSAAAAAAAAEKKRQDEERAKAQAARKQQEQLIQAGVAALLVLALGIGAFVVVRARQAGGSGPSPGGKPTGGKAPPVEGPPGVVLKGVNEAAGKTLVIRADELAGQIGVEVGKTAAFGSPGTSRRHARLVWAPPQGLVLRDLGSMNGTRVNGREIKGAPDQPVNFGDIIEFGAPDARYQIEKL